MKTTGKKLVDATTNNDKIQKYYAYYQAKLQTKQCILMKQIEEDIRNELKLNQIIFTARYPPR